MSVQIIQRGALYSSAWNKPSWTGGEGLIFLGGGEPRVLIYIMWDVLMCLTSRSCATGKHASAMTQCHDTHLALWIESVSEPKKDLGVTGWLVQSIRSNHIINI